MIKTLADFFFLANKGDSKIQVVIQMTYSSQNNFEKNEQIIQDLVLSDFKTYSNAIVNKIVQCWYKGEREHVGSLPQRRDFRSKLTHLVSLFQKETPI